MGRSLQNNKNNVGPKTGPFGTLELDHCYVIQEVVVVALLLANNLLAWYSPSVFS